MTYSKGDVAITISNEIDGAKRIGLWVGAGNQWAKLGTFNSEDNALVFCKWLEYFFFDREIDGIVVRKRDREKP